MRLKFRGFEFESFADLKLMMKFVAVFSRFEYALKLDGFTSVNPKNSVVSADWDTFASTMRGHFNKERTDRLKKATRYILMKPPKRQVVANNALSWASWNPGFTSDLENLLLYVRTMRNNLFHGGKSQAGSPMEIDRNARLLRCGLTVLAECLELCRTHRPGLVSHFEAY
jgi:hypothetical protein